MGGSKKCKNHINVFYRLPFELALPQGKLPSAHHSLPLALTTFSQGTNRMSTLSSNHLCSMTYWKFQNRDNNAQSELEIPK